MTGELRWSGHLDMHDPDEQDGSPVLAAARDAFATAAAEGMREALETVLSAARVGPLLIDLTAAGPDQPWQLTATPLEGGDWIPVFSSVDELAQWRQYCSRGNETVHYAALPGTQLPALLPTDGPQPVGIVLDPASQTPVALPADQLNSEVEGS